MSIKPKQKLSEKLKSFIPRPVKPKPNQFLFEDRAMLIADLIALKYSAKKGPPWAISVQACLQQTPFLAPLANSLNDATKAEGVDAQIADVIDAALRLVERHPIAAFGRDTNGLISQVVEEAVQKSAPARLLRWGAPLLIAGIFGGTLYWGVKVDGLEKTRREIETQLEKAKVEATNVITRFQESLDKESRNRLEELTRLVELAKNNARNTINTEVGSLPIFFSSERTRLTQNGNDLLKAAVDKVTEPIQAPTKIKEIENKLGELNTKISETKALVAEVRSLRGELESANGVSVLTATQILRIFEIKDWIAISAATASVLALCFSLGALLRRP